MILSTTMHHNAPLFTTPFITQGETTAMLVLARRINEVLNIGDDVTITVLGIKGNQVRLGINAPKDLPVHREEVYLRIQNEKSGIKTRVEKNHEPE